jgi:hypothetical protein
MPNYENFSLSFKNEHLIMEQNIKCKIKNYEMNYSYNPSLLASGSQENMVYFASGSDFTPYATMLGIYNDTNDLIAVAKFSQPLPLSPETDTNIIVRIDV